MDGWIYYRIRFDWMLGVVYIDCDCLVDEEENDDGDGEGRMEGRK